MSGGPQEQRNPYRGTSARAWLRVRLVALDGSAKELDLLVDTGNPFPLIISEDMLRRFSRQKTRGAQTNFGRMTGGWLRVVIPDVGFDSRMIVFASDHIVATAKASDPAFEGLVGLPLLRMLEYGGDADWFWIRPAAQVP